MSKGLLLPALQSGMHMSLIYMHVHTQLPVMASCRMPAYEAI